LEPELLLELGDLLRRNVRAELHHHLVGDKARLVDRWHAARQRPRSRARHEILRRPVPRIAAVSAAGGAGTPTRTTRATDSARSGEARVAKLHGIEIATRCRAAQDIANDVIRQRDLRVLFPVR